MDKTNTRNRTPSLFVLASLTAILLISSCVGCFSSKHVILSHQLKKKTFPVNSFVKIFRFIKVSKCLPISGSECRSGITFSSSGSGVILYSDKKGSLVMTAGHMCNVDVDKGRMMIEETEKSIKLLTIKNKKFDAVVIHKEVRQGTDLCMLYSKKMRKHQTSKISNQAPQTGDLAYNIAAPAGIFHPPAVPLLSGYYSGYMKDSDSDMYTIPAVGGSSGSPVFNERFEIIGNIYAAATRFSHMSVSTTHKNMLKFIKTSLKIIKEKKAVKKVPSPIKDVPWF